MNILETIDDKNLFRPWFKSPETWTAWRAFLAALFGLTMDYKARRIFKGCTQRQRPPTGQVSEGLVLDYLRGEYSAASLQTLDSR